MAANFREKTSGSGIYYLPSADIQVFPSTYRNKVNGTIYDPEAKLNTELNYTRIPGYNKKESYIISWSGSNLEIVLHGYYFKIANLSLADCLHPFVGIKVEEVNLLDPASGSSAKTKILKPFESTNGAQDNALDIDILGTAYFAGLAFTDNAGDLQLIDGSGHEYKGNRLPAIEANRDPSIADIFEGSFNTQLKDGAGATANYAVTLGGNAEASNIRSVAMGDHTVAKNENQVVLGAYNADAANSLFIIGNGTADDARSNAFEVYKDGTVKAPTKFVSPALDVTTITGTGTNGALGITGDTTFNNTVNITDTTNGALQVAGGASIGGSAGIYDDLSVGGHVSIGTKNNDGLSVQGNTTLWGTTITNGALSVLDSNNRNILFVNEATGGFYDGVKIGSDVNGGRYPLEVFGSTTLHKSLKIYDDTDITHDSGGSFSTASFVTNGGAYIAKKLVVASTAGAPDSAPGALDVYGGISVRQNVRIGSTAEATSSSSALYVSGGAKLGKNLRVGTDLYVNNRTTLNSWVIINKWIHFPNKNAAVSAQGTIFGAYDNAPGGQYTTFIPDEINYVPTFNEDHPDTAGIAYLEGWLDQYPIYVIWPQQPNDGSVYSTPSIKLHQIDQTEESSYTKPLIAYPHLWCVDYHGEVVWEFYDFAGNNVKTFWQDEGQSTGFQYKGVMYRIN